VDVEFVPIDTNMMLLTNTFYNLTNGTNNEWSCTSTTHHTLFMFTLHFMRNIVFRMVVRRYFSSLLPHQIKCCTNNQFLDQREINLFFKHCKCDSLSEPNQQTNPLSDTYKLHAQPVDSGPCDSVLQLQYKRHSYHSAMIKILLAVYSCCMVSTHEQYNNHHKTQGYICLYHSDNKLLI
jgi:hypothetical protein